MALILHILHVLGAVFIIGPMTVMPMLALRAIRRSDTVQLAGLWRSSLGLGIGSVVVAALGFGVMSTGETDDHWSMSTPWILWSAIIYGVAAILFFAVVLPVLRRASLTTTTRSAYGVLASSSGIVALLLVAVVVLMVAQPGQ